MDALTSEGIVEIIFVGGGVGGGRQNVIVSLIVGLVCVQSLEPTLDGRDTKHRYKNYQRHLCPNF